MGYSLKNKKGNLKKGFPFFCIIFSGKAQDRSMKTFFLILFIILIVLLVISYPLKVRCGFHVNLLLNVGYISFNLAFIRLLAERFKINNKLEFEGEKERNSKHKKLLTSYINNLTRRVDVKKLDLFFDVGVKDEACFVSLFCGYINSIVIGLFAALLSKYKNLDIYLKTNPYFNKESLEATGEMIVTFNLIDVVVSLLKAINNTKRRV